MLKSVIDSVPVYWFNLYKLSKVVTDQIEQLRRNFFWGHKEGQQRKLHLTNWETVCASKKFGGLGVKSISGRNLALLEKWWWRAYSDRSALWNKILSEKYGPIWNFDMALINQKSCSPIFRNIISVKLDRKCDLVTNRSNFRWNLQDGNQAFFWEDIWLNDLPLQYIYPELYALSAHKSVVVAVYYKLWCSIIPGVSMWTQAPEHHLREQVSSLDTLLSSLVLSSRGDVLVWKPVNGPYTVRKGYDAFYLPLSSIRSDFNWQSIWSIQAPPKIKVFFMENLF